MVSYWKLPFIVDLAIYSMVIFHSYVSLPEGIWKKLFLWASKEGFGFSRCLKNNVSPSVWGLFGICQSSWPGTVVCAHLLCNWVLHPQVVRFVRQLWENRHDFHGTSSYTFHVSHKKWWDYPSGNPRFLDTPKSDILGDVLQKYTLW